MSLSASRWRARKECVVGPCSKLFPDKPATNLRIVEIAFIYINPFSANDLPAALSLLGPGYAVVDSHGLEEAHLHVSAGPDHVGVQGGAGDVVDRSLDPVLDVQAVELTLQDDLPLATFGSIFNSVSIKSA